MSGVTPSGISIKRLPQIKEEIEGDLEAAFGRIDTRAESVFGQLIGISAEEQAKFWELVQDVYHSQYPDSATGASLDYAVRINGVTRIPATPTQVEAICYGTHGTFLPVGREAKNPDTDDVYRTLIDATISRDNAAYAKIEVDTVAAGTYTVTVGALSYTYEAGGGDDAQAIIQGLFDAMAAAPFDRAIMAGALVITTTSATAFVLTANLATEEVGTPVDFAAIHPGAKLLPVGALTEIETPVAGWDSVDNLTPGITGGDRETDEALRLRRSQSIQITATNTRDAIEARLKQVPLVLDVVVEVNDGEVTDAFGTPRQHIWVIAEGGADDAIADVIYNVAAGGIGLRGAVEVTVTSPISGKDFTINFDRPTYVDPLLVVEFTRLSGFPADGTDQLTENLIAYGNGLKIGQDLIFSRIYSPLNKVAGVQIDSILIDGTTANITTAPNEKVRILEGNITLVDIT